MIGDWNRALAIIFVAQVVSSLGFSVVLPLLPLYVEHLGSGTGLGTATLAGLVFSAQSFAMMVAAPVWGRLADRYGRKRMVLRAIYSGSVVMTAMAFAPTAEALVLLSALQGLVTGTVTAIAALVAANAPRARVGHAMSLMQVGQWGGIAVGPVVGGVVADAFGFEAIFFVTASLLAGSGILVHLGLQESFSRGAARGVSPGIVANLRRVLATGGVVAVYRLRALDWLGRTMVMPFIPLFVAALLADGPRVASATGVIFATSAVAGITSSLFLGRLGDRIGHRRIVVACALLAGTFYALHALVDAYWHFVVLQALAGAALGGLLPSLSTLLSQLSDPSDAGAVYGADGSINAGARAVAPMIGATLVVWFGLQGLFVMSGLVFLCIAVLAARTVPRVGEGPSDRVQLRREPQAASTGDPSSERLR